MPEVVVYLLEGRTLEQKRGLVKDITQAVVKNAGTTADQVTVSLVETPKTAKAKGGVLFASRSRQGALRPSRRFLSGGLSLGLRRCGDLSPRPLNIAVIAMHNGIAALR